MKAKARAERIEGIIKNPVGIAGGREGACTFVAILGPWRIEGREIVKKDLRLEVPCPNQAAASRAWGRSRAGQAITLTVTGPRLKKGWPWWDATAMGRIRQIDPAAFAATTKELSAVRTFKDPILGSLRLEREWSWYATSRSIGRRRCSIAVEVHDPDDDAKVTKAVGAAGAIVRAVERGWTKLLGTIADELLDTCNDSWREGGRPVSRAAFMAKLRPSEIIVGPTRTTIHLGCGGLFGEHGVEVRLDRKARTREIFVS